MKATKFINDNTTNKQLPSSRKIENGTLRISPQSTSSTNGLHELSLVDISQKENSGKSQEFSGKCEKNSEKIPRAPKRRGSFDISPKLTQRFSERLKNKRLSLPDVHLF
eukprot:TRINITY_DN15198_c0_g1_i1.p1 TRINITY_DN15198_c0_g1~~TRINITY_DN15198_c0_g1_i1.p1  ORF type:complete len:109 (+),score=12.32 TRINITY_DN15198_c0_g1_i1:132-458(+)